MKYLIKQRTEELIMEWDFRKISNYTLIGRVIKSDFCEILNDRKYHDNPIKPLYSEVDIRVGDYVDGHLVKYKDIVNGIPVLELSDNIKRTFLNTKDDVINCIKDKCINNKSLIIYHDILERMYDRANKYSNEWKSLPIEFLSKEEDMYLNCVDIFYNVKCKTPLERFAKRMQFINYKCGGM
ncbi:MAG: hypothetical protein ACRCXT_15050 [Paraclostridium sp.]